MAITDNMQKGTSRMTAMDQEMITIDIILEVNLLHQKPATRDIRAMAQRIEAC